ncbi:MAG TPA: HAD family phosphatase [Actinotalea sp.]|nr:HAD family phosphatase [Actinotalea sp.]
MRTPSPTAVPAPTAASARSPRLPEAVLWDMDGTLVDTEPCWMAAETTLVRRFGGAWTSSDAQAMIGLPLLEGAAVLAAHGVDLPLPEIVERLLDSVVEAVAADLTWQPGALRLLEALGAAGVPCALVTMSYGRFADAVLDRIPQGAFDVVVTGDQVTHGKPHPEPYLRAAELLGVDVTRCVAIEDSVPGVGSAVAAGARTLVVEHVVPVADRPGMSRAGSLADVGLEEITRIARGEVLDLRERTR